MILTICPNPSMDCTIELDALNVGKLNRISNKVETYSGKALNVAMGVARATKSARAYRALPPMEKRVCAAVSRIARRRSPSV